MGIGAFSGFIGNMLILVVYCTVLKGDKSLDIGVFFLLAAK